MIGVLRPILTAVLVDGDYASTVSRFSCPSDPAVQEFHDDRVSGHRSLAKLHRF